MTVRIGQIASNRQGTPHGRHVCDVVTFPKPDGAKAQMRLGSLVQQIEDPSEMPSVARFPILIIDIQIV